MNKVGIMMDIETLDLAPRAIVTQLAFVAFDLDDPTAILREVEEYLPIQPQLALSRTLNADTLIWWMQQSDDARAKFKASSGNDMDEITALVNSVATKMGRVIADADYYELWARGPQFDAVVVESLLGDFGQETPWKYDTVRDLRTLLGLAGVDTKADVPMPTGLTSHHALSDCKYQILCYEEGMRKLRAAV